MATVDAIAGRILVYRLKIAVGSLSISKPCVNNRQLIDRSSLCTSVASNLQGRACLKFR
jgi:hypothetical protein